MLKGLLPPFKIGEKRCFLWKDTIGGASPAEWGFVALLLSLVCALIF